MGFWRTLARLVVNFRALIVVVSGLAVAVLVPPAQHLAHSLDVASRVRGSESAAVEDALRKGFDSPLGIWVLLVVRGGPSVATPDGRQLLQLVVDSVRTVPGVTRTLSWLDHADSSLVGAAGDGALVIVGLDPGGAAPDALMPELRRATAGVRQAVATHHSGLTLHWTGAVAFNRDFRQTSSADVAAAEARALPVTLLLLLLAFGTIVSAALPLLAGLMAIGLSLGAAVLLAQYFSISILLVNVVAMIGLGLGVDYALLMVSRFRQALAEGADGRGAAIIAAQHGGHTIAIAGLSVSIGFGALAFVRLDELRSVALGGLLVTFASMVIATTLLPGILSWLGRRIDAGPMPWQLPSASLARWTAWGNYVTARPGRVLLVASPPVMLLAAQSLRINTDIESGDLLPPRMEATQGFRDLQAMHRGAMVGSLSVLVDLPDAESAVGEAGWGAVHQLSDWLARQPGVSQVRSLPTAAGEWHPLLIQFLPADARRSFVSRDGRSALLSVVPQEAADRHDLDALVRRIRATAARELTGLDGARVRVGGIAAFQADYGAAVRDRRLMIAALVIGGTLIALFAGFRSLLVPLKAVLLNLLSVFAAIGALVLVFQDGHGAALIGLDAPTGGIFSSVPLLVFCIVFGLSMDYEVFLVARVREARLDGLDERAAIVEGLARTGAVITSAAAIMVAVFAAFTLGEFVQVKMLGLALAVAVAIDATVVRLAIGPALLQLAGDWNWWPGRTRSAPPVLS